MTTIPYAEELVLPTAAELKEEWKVMPREGDLPTLNGKCPRCNHPSFIVLYSDVVGGGQPSAASPLQVEPVPRRVGCACRKAHGAPVGVRAGCGGYWFGRVREVEPQHWVVEVESDTTLYPALSLLADRQADQDPRISAAGEKWITGTTALTGLFSLAGLSTAKDALSGVGTLWRVGVATLFVLALAAAATAVVLGYTVAYGWPRLDSVRSAAKVKAWADSQDNHARVAVPRLRWAVVLSVTAVTLLAFLALVLWFAPRTAQPATSSATGVAGVLNIADQSEPTTAGRLQY